MTKLSIIGAGFVGSTAAYVAGMKGIFDEISLIDILDKPAQGKALDIFESMPIFNSKTVVVGGADYKLAADSDIVIITAGVPRKPDQKREDTLKINAKIMASVIEHVTRQAPEAIIIVVTNPLDAMTHLAAKLSKFPKQRVIGMAGTLDTARFKTFLAKQLNVSPDKIEAMVLGGHGDLMVPLSRLAKVNGKPLRLDTDTLHTIEHRTRVAGAEIVDLLGNGSAYFATGAAAIELAEAIITDSKKVLPASAYLTGQYGLDDLFLGVPIQLGRTGVEKVVEIDLDEEELRQLHASAELVRKLTSEF